MKRTRGQIGIVTSPTIFLFHFVQNVLRFIPLHESRHHWFPGMYSERFEAENKAPTIERWERCFCVYVANKAKTENIE